MNASAPASGTVANGQNPPRNAPVLKKKPKAADPFFAAKKKTPVYRQLAPPAKREVNGAPVPIIKPQPGPSPAASGVLSPARASPARADRNRVSGFGDPNGTVGGVAFRDYKVVLSKRDKLDGLRFHVLQVNGDKAIDIRKEEDFTRPVRLHRRDPKATPAEQAHIGDGQDTKEGLDLEERVELDKRKEARRLEREANLAQVAPSADAGKRSTTIKKKTAQVYNRDYTVEERRKMQNNYEEKLPWIIEDFDNKHCYVGSQQAGSTNVHVAFVYEQSPDGTDGRFRVLPIEKMYQFKPRKTYRTMTIEEAENAMKKKGRDPRWIIEKREANQGEAQLEMLARRNKAYFGTKDDSAAGRADEGADLDFNVEEDFADDEEGDAFFGKDEDEILAENRIKEDQLNANVFDIKEETEYDRAEEKERKEKERKRLVSKGIRKALEKREKNFDHGSDSDDPFGSTSDSEDSEVERQRLEAEKKAKVDHEAKRSGISTGTNTPLGRKEKPSGTASDREGGMKNSTSSKSLKRPGSPNISDASGTDASLARKKKKNRHLSSTQPASHPSRPTSPSNLPPSSSAPAATSNLRRDSNTSQPLDPTTTNLTVPTTKKRKSLAPSTTTAAGSDTDTGGGAMSDASRKQKRPKLNVNRPDSSRTPNNNSTLTPLVRSRATSPKPTSFSTTAPAQQQQQQKQQSSLPRQTLPNSDPEPDPSTYPTAAEVYAAIPSTGITTKDLSNIFRHRYRQQDRPQMLARVKEVGRFDRATKLLFPVEGFMG